LDAGLLLLAGILNRTHTVSSSCSRKSFFAKLGGAIAALGLAPALFSRSAANTKTAPVAVRPEARAVPRQSGTC